MYMKVLIKRYLPTLLNTVQEQFLYCIIFNDASKYYVSLESVNSIDEAISDSGGHTLRITSWNDTGAAVTGIAIGDWVTLQLRCDSIDNLQCRVKWGYSGFGSWHTIF